MAFVQNYIIRPDTFNRLTDVLGIITKYFDDAWDNIIKTLDSKIGMGVYGIMSQDNSYGLEAKLLDSAYNMDRLLDSGIDLMFSSALPQMRMLISDLENHINDLDSTMNYIQDYCYSFQHGYIFSGTKVYYFASVLPVFAYAYTKATNRAISWGDEYKHYNYGFGFIGSYH